MSMINSTCGLKRTAWDSSTNTIPTGFAARCLGDLFSWHWNPGLGGLGWGWDSSLLRYPSQIFIHHTWVWDQPVPLCTPPPGPDGCGFFNSIVVRLPFNSISDGSE